MIEADIDLFHRYGTELADAVERALPDWVRQAVERFLPPDPELGRTVEAAGRAAADDIGARLRDLLARDIDGQWTNPLSILRAAAVHPTRVLAANGVPPVERDRHARRIHPDDIYDLTPSSFSDFGPEVHELGIRWGAAKAHLHLRRRRAT